jgi:hypothetical protein
MRYFPTELILGRFARNETRGSQRPDLAPLGCLRGSVGNRKPFGNGEGFRRWSAGLRSLLWLSWRRGRDSNPRYGFPYTHFPGVRLQPLGHPSTHSAGGKPQPVTRRTIVRRRQSANHSAQERHGEVLAHPIHEAWSFGVRQIAGAHFCSDFRGAAGGTFERV